MKVCPACNSEIHDDYHIDMIGNGIWYRNRFVKLTPKQTEFLAVLRPRPNVWHETWDVMHGIYGHAAEEKDGAEILSVYRWWVNKRMAEENIPLRIEGRAGSNRGGYRLVYAD